MTNEVIEKIMLAVVTFVVIVLFILASYGLFTTSFACAKPPAVVSEARLQRDALIDLLKRYGYKVTLNDDMACASPKDKTTPFCSFYEGYSPF